MIKRSTVIAMLVPGIALACGTAGGTGSADHGYDPGHDLPDPGGNLDAVPVDPGAILDDVPFVEVAWDPGVDPGSDSAADAPPDSPPPPLFCRRVDGCGPGEVCNLTTGGCEKRAAILSSESGIYTFQPHVAAPGDHIVIDGQGFYSGISGSWAVKVYIGGKLAGSINDMEVDENRIVLTAAGGMVGLVNVTGNADTAASNENLLAGASGIIPCGYDDPGFVQEAADEPVDPGPYAAGFVDFAASGGGRAYYPALCGGIRRPVADGLFRVAVICHGDGAVGLNYEYLAQHLATWGFVSLIPYTGTASDISDLANDPYAAFGGPVSAPGMNLDSGVVLVGHSRGTDRIEQAWGQFNYPAVIVYLGPVNSGKLPKDVPLLIFGATGDGQSSVKGFVDPLYSEHPGPKWKIVIQGGNHSAFTDHKVWQGMLSDQPLEIERSLQMAVVQQFTLPFIQRFLGGPEAFGTYLEAPPIVIDYTFDTVH